MPVKLSGALIEEARDSAKLFHRSLTSQIEHWATLGRAIEARLSVDAVASLLENHGSSLKITDVADPSQRQQVVAALAGFLSQSPEAKNHSWLTELSEQGIPLFGTKEGGSEIVRRDPSGREVLVNVEKAAAAN